MQPIAFPRSVTRISFWGSMARLSAKMRPKNHHGKI